MTVIGLGGGIAPEADSGEAMAYLAGEVERVALTGVPLLDPTAIHVAALLSRAQPA
jgi:hypothetical protein